MRKLTIISLLIFILLLVRVVQNIHQEFGHPILHAEYKIDPMIIKNLDNSKFNKIFPSIQEAYEDFVNGNEYAQFKILLFNESSSTGKVNLTFIMLSDEKSFCGIRFCVEDQITYLINFISYTNVTLSCINEQPFIISGVESVGLIVINGCKVFALQFKHLASLSMHLINSIIERSKLYFSGPYLHIRNSTLLNSKIEFSGNTDVTDSMFKQSSIFITLGLEVRFYNVKERDNSVFAFGGCNNLLFEQLEFSRSFGKLYVHYFKTIRIEKSTFNSDMVRRPPVYLFSGENILLSNIKSKSIPQFLTISSVNEVTINNMELTDSVVTSYCMYRTPITISDCNIVNVFNSFFWNNAGSIYGGSVSLTNYYRTTFVNNTFTNNIAQHGGAVYFGFCQADFEFKCSVNVTNNTFLDNNALVSGGAMYILFCEYVTIKDNVFLRNSGEVSGGAIMVDFSSHLFFENSHFEQNVVLIESSNHVFSLTDGDISDVVLHGGGGAVTIRSFVSVDVQNCLFKKNKASRGGGFIIGMNNLDNIPEHININYCTFSENIGVQGRAAHFVNIPNVALDFTTSSYQNQQDFSSAPSKFYLEEYDPKLVHLGRQISVKIYAENYFKEKMTLRNQIIQFNQPQDLYLKFEYSPEGHLLITPYGKTDKIELTERVVVIYSEDALFSFNMSIVLDTCPFRHSLDTIAVGKVALYGCVKDSIDLDLVIGISVPGSIILLLVGMVLGLLSFYMVKQLSMQIWTLKKKQKAEKNLEMRIIDKKIIFNDLPTKSDQSATRSKGSRYSELSSPLIDPTDLPSFIIPIEHVDIVKKLAEGGLGIIYLGKLWKKIDVAIKLLKSSDQSDDFESEASLLSSLRHDNILTFYGICLTEENKYMITEYADLGSLDKALYRSRIGEIKLSLHKKISILIATAKGIEYLHNLTPIVVHRDLKPGNILLDGKNIAKICDFGLSRTISNSSMQSVMTTNMGTLFYCPSEIIEGPNEENMASKQTATKIDVYSFAVIMWEVFFELVPYSSSVKLTPLYPISEQDSNKWENVSLFNIPSLVSKGLRPIIPFKTHEQIKEWIDQYMTEERTTRNISSIVSRYFDIVQRNWVHNATQRSSISSIRSDLEELLLLLE